MATQSKDTVPTERVCFFVTPLGDDGSPTRARADDVMEFILVPALAECGYTTPPVRADKMPNPGRITRQIIDQLIKADLVIADLTDHNPNVFYELAIRHAARKPVVQIIHVKDKLPFDVANQRTIFYDHQNLRSAHDAVSKIVHQIKAAEANPGDVDTPLSEALLIDALSQSADPVAKSNSEIIAVLQNIQSEIVYLRRAEDARRFIAQLPPNIPPVPFPYGYTGESQPSAGVSASVASLMRMFAQEASGKNNIEATELEKPIDSD